MEIIERDIDVSSLINEELGKITTPVSNGLMPTVRNITVGAFVLLCPYSSIAKVKTETDTTLTEIVNYEKVLFNSMKPQTNPITVAEKAQSNWVDNSLDVVSLSNSILSVTERMEGEALECLDELFNNSGVSTSTLPNRL